MKALSLWQPWASLMADGRKRIETRHWRPPVWLLGQELAIHATIKVDSEMCIKFGYEPLIIPRGCIVAIMRMNDFVKFDADAWEDSQFMHETDYGNFDMGRFGWKCTLLEKLNPPIAARGHQGIWDWER